MRIGITTYGYLYTATLDAALESIAGAGYRLVEIAPAPPHVFLTSGDRAPRQRLIRQLGRLELECVSINPTELNLISANPDLREVALRQYSEGIRLAHELGAHVVVIVPGRQSQLIPMPRAAAIELLLEQLTILAKEAHEHRVDLAVETVPFGFLESASEVAGLVTRLGDERVGIALDVANIYGREDVTAAVSTAAPLLRIAHLSDTWRHRWAHAAIGAGEVDFPAFLDALSTSGYSGPCVYELVDGIDPAPRIKKDLETLAGWGVSA